jgi:nucleoside-diphosphate-sugar epimerase
MKIQDSNSVLTKRAKYIVTGGAGFIGSHLVKALLDAHSEIIVLDNFSAGLHENLPKHDLLTVYKTNIADKWQMDALAAEPKMQGVAGVFHLAAEARIQPSIEYPDDAFNANALGTFHVLEMMREFGIKNIVYSASSSSYGRKNKPPLKESMAPDCLNPYATTKLIGEMLCKGHGKTYGINNVCLKYFNVYGPRSPIHLGAYSPVIGLFFQQALQNEPMTIVGDGQQKRDFTYVDDVVRANWLAMLDLTCQRAFSPINDRTINIGTGENKTIVEIAFMVKDALNHVRPETEIKLIDARPGESRETLADRTVARDFLGWEPEVFIADGIKRLTPYYLDLFNVRPETVS